MTSPRGGLGRGLGALFPDARPAADRLDDVLAHVPGATLRNIPVGAVEANPRQPRSNFDEEALSELAESIRAVGLLQPIIVRELARGRYQLVMGERRWRASLAAGLTEVPAIVRSTPDDALLRDALLENLHREQLNPLEEAAAYSQLLEDFGVTHDELARRLGRSRSRVTNTIRLLNLPPPVQRRVAAGVLSAGHARALLALDDGQAQERLAARAVAEGLSVRAVEEEVSSPGRRPARDPGTGRPVRDRPQLDDVAAVLADRFDTRARVELGRSKGRIIVEFASMDDLRRIVALMVPDDDLARLDPPQREAVPL